MKPPRGLSAEEAAAWARLAATVKPLRPASLAKPVDAASEPGTPTPKPPKGRVPATRPQCLPAPPPSPSLGLDSTWDRKLARGTLAPDFTLDLHGHTLASAHARLDDGLTQAKALGARVVLLITGKSRPAEAADRGHQRGAIRAKVLDWLAAGPHASSIAAVRKAHIRHGGEGALYLILRKARRA
jgi:DNA-nicking Smr family endonuclease